MYVTFNWEQVKPVSSKRFKLCDLNLNSLKSEIINWYVKETARHSLDILKLPNRIFSSQYVKKKVLPYVSSCWEVKCSSLIWAIFVGPLVGQIGHVSKDRVSGFCFYNLHWGRSWRNLEKCSDMSIFIPTSWFSFLEKYTVHHLRFRNWLIWCLVRKQFCAVNICCWIFDGR